MKSPLITLLTDFGSADHYVAAMKGVMLGICPGARLVDISHEVTPFAIAEGAYTLAQAWECFPRGTTHLAVVDPGVGSSRRAIMAEVAGHRFVAPDNGLLSMVLATHRKYKIREISAIRYFREPVDSTFHGRDIFAPVAAHMAKGLSLAKLGKLISDPTPGLFAKPIQSGPGRWTGAVLKVDRFGNIITNFDWPSFQGIATTKFKMKLGGRTLNRYCSKYSSAPPGQLFAIEGSSGYVEMSLNQSDASKKLGVVPGSQIELCLEVLLGTTLDGGTHV